MYKNVYVVDLYDDNRNFKRTLTVNFNYSFFKNLFKNKTNMIIGLLNTSNGYLEGYKKYYFKDSPKRKVLLVPPEKHIGYNH